MKLRRMLALVLCFAMVLSTMSFSVFAEDDIVTVSSLVDLQEALAADNDLPIEITAKIEISANETVELDLNGKTINAAWDDEDAEKHIYALSNNGTLTIKDSVGNGAIISRGIYNYGTLVLESGKIEACDGNGGYAVNNEGSSTFTMDGGAVVTTYDDDPTTFDTGDATAIDVCVGNTTTLNGGKISCVSNWCYAVSVDGTLVVPEDSTVSVTGVHGAVSTNSSGTTTIGGGTFVCEGATNASSDHVLYVSGNGYLTVNDGTFTNNNVDPGSNGVAVCADGDETKVEINDGIFTGCEAVIYGNENTVVNGGSYELHWADIHNIKDSLAQYVTEGATVIVAGTKMTKTESGLEEDTSATETTVATIDDVPYESLADALEATREMSGDIVIELLADAEFSYGAREAYGKADTTAITINGNDNTLTLNQTDSDWSSIGMANADGVFKMNNVTVVKTGYGATSGAWNTHAINFNVNTEFEDVTFNNSIKVSGISVLTNVDIVEAGGYYGIWIPADATSVTINGGSITATNGGRGIKIADEYVDTPVQVKLTVDGMTFETAKKAAVLVSSTAGADIAAKNCDISKVAADSENFAWVDEDWADSADQVKVNGEAVFTEGTVATVNGAGYTDVATAFAAATDGAEVKIFAAGTYKVPTGKDITITGAVDGVVFGNIGAHNMGGASVIFNNVTFDYLPNTTYTGLQHSGDLVYNNCTFNGTVFLYGTSETFNNCTFNVEDDAYNVWTYGAKNVEFNNCVFNSAGKCVLVYNEGACVTDLTVVNTEFNASQAVEGKAAIEIDTTLMPQNDVVDIVIDDKTTANGFDEGSKSGSTLWNDKKVTDDTFSGSTTSKVTVAGELVKSEKPSGQISYAYASKDDAGNVHIWGEGGTTVAYKSYVLKVYSGEELIATTELNNIDGIIDGSVYVTWHFFYPSSNDPYWTTTWETGHPNSAAMPDKIVCVADGIEVSENVVKMNGPDNLWPVVWKELGGVRYAPTGLEGEGTEENPYLINNIEELMWFRDNVDKQAQDGSTQYAGKYIKLTTDIDLAGINWNPIGSMSGDKGTFKGIFDGDGHTISNLNIQTTGNGLGFFARTAGNAVIKNLTFNNVRIKSTDNSNYVGTVVANSFASTKIENVHVKGNIDISGRGYIGGISGHGYVVMDNVSVIGEGVITSSFWCAGGILGYGGEGTTNIMNAKVEGTGNGLLIESAAGGLGTIVGMAEDNNGTQPISGSNLSAKNVKIETYVGAYGTNYSDYALGYLYGGNSTSKLTGELKVEDVTIKTSTGDTAPEVVDAVATIGNVIYFNFDSAAKAVKPGETITLVRDAKGTITLGTAPEAAAITLASADAITVDLNGMTLEGNVMVYQDATVEVQNGIIINNNKEVSAAESTGNLTLTDVEVVSARHAVRIEGGTAEINGGSYKALGTSGMTTHAVNVSGNGTVVTINGGTFAGANGTVSDSGAAVNVQTGSKVVINDGTFKDGKADTLNIGKDATLEINGGTFVGKFRVADSATFSITDGEFSVKPDDKYVVAPAKFVQRSADNYWVVIKARTIELKVQGDLEEVETSTEFKVDVMVGGVSPKSAKWELSYEEEYFELKGIETSYAMQNSDKLKPEIISVNGTMDTTKPVATYTFISKTKAVTDSPIVFVENTADIREVTDVWGDTIVTDTVTATNTDMTVVLRQYEGMTVKLDEGTDNETVIVGDTHEFKYDGQGHRFTVTGITPAGATVIYKVNGEEVTGEPVIKKFGEHKIEYTVDGVAGYEAFTQTVTITVLKPDYVVEVAFGEDSDYVDGTKLVLVYTNAEDVSFDFDGVKMFDVTNAKLYGGEYLYNGTTPYEHVYALVVEALSTSELKSYEAKIVLDYENEAEKINYDPNNDINFNGRVTWDDISAAYTVLEKDEYAFTQQMKGFIKADTNRDKRATSLDVSPIITDVYGQ